MFVDGIIGNARINTVMYGLPSERTREQDRPKKYGERLAQEDFELEFPKNGDWKTGVCRCSPGYGVEGDNLVLLPKNENGSRRLFFLHQSFGEHPFGL